MATFIIKPKDLQAASLAAGVEDERPYLQGVYIEPVSAPDTERNNIRMVATNGHLMVTVIGENHIHEVVKTFVPFILPSKMIKTLLSIVGNALTGKRRTHSVVLEFNTRLQVIEIGYGINDLVQHIQTVSYVPVDGTFIEWTRVIPIRYAEDAGVREIGINPGYMQTICKAFDIHGERSMIALKWSFGDANSPILITEPTDRMQAVLMPVRMTP